MDTSFPLLVFAPEGQPLSATGAATRALSGAHRRLAHTGEWQQSGADWVFVVEGLVGGHVFVLSGPLLQDTITQSY